MISHHAGIAVAGNAVIGNDCLIRQNVTIGMARYGGRSPCIGDAVQIGAGAVIVGDIVIGDGAIIGPNSVVTTDVPARARVVAAPSRILLGLEEASSRPMPPRPGGESAELPDAEEVASVVRDALALKTAIEVDTPLLSSGLVDSLNLVVLLDTLESRYAVPVPFDDVSAESFDTPRQIADYLRNQHS